MSKRILALTDSLALPRNRPEECSYEDTWPSLLDAAGYTVHRVSIGGATSTDLSKQIDYHKNFRPEIVVVQVGIVDCAPRFLTQFEVSVVRKLGILGKVIFKLTNNNFVKRLRNICYIKPKKFAQNLQDINNGFKESKIIYLGIVPATAEYELQLPGINRRIAQFNNILQQMKGYINLNDFDMAGVMTDHHHLNKDGQRQVYQKVLNRINA